MTVFIKKGDAPLSVCQATKRGMAHVEAELAQAGARTGDAELLRVIPQENLPAKLLDVAKALGHVSYEAFALGWEADNSVNGANNLFNHQLAVYRAAQARVARYRLADGRPAVTEERQVIDEKGNPLFDKATREPLMETVVMQGRLTQSRWKSIGRSMTRRLASNPAVLRCPTRIQNEMTRNARQRKLSSINPPKKLFDLRTLMGSQRHDIQGSQQTVDGSG